MNRCARAVAAAFAAAVTLPRLQAQTPRIAPPPPCRSGGLVPTVDALLSRPGRRNRPVVAVLEAEARISDARHRHVAWALADRLTSRLRGDSHLAVETRSSTARAWADAGGSVDRLASSLGAALVVSGAVVADRGGARVTVRLSVPGSDSAVWQGEYIYPDLTLGAIEDEMAAAVARHFKVDTPPRTRLVAGEEAYDALARGDYFLARHDPWAADSARAVFQRALQSYPRSALFMARLARAYAVSLERSGRAGALGRDVAVREALGLVDRALEVDRALAKAWTTRAMLLRLRDPRRYAGAVTAHERAARLAPRSADAREQFAKTLMRLGRDDAARAQLREAIRAEPDRSSSLRLLAELEYLGRHYAAACALVNASIGGDSYDPLAYALRARVRMQLGELRDAFSDAETASLLSRAEWAEALQFYVTATSSDVDAVQTEARRIALARLKKGVAMSVREAAFLGMAFAAAGDLDRAFDALSRSGPAGPELRAALRDPGFDAVRRDPRFRRVGTGESAALSGGRDTAASTIPRAHVGR